MGERRVKPTRSALLLAGSSASGFLSAFKKKQGAMGEQVKHDKGREWRIRQPQPEQGNGRRCARQLPGGGSNHTLFWNGIFVPSLLYPHFKSEVFA